MPQFGPFLGVRENGWDCETDGRVVTLPTAGTKTHMSGVRRQSAKPGDNEGWFRTALERQKLRMRGRHPTSLPPLGSSFLGP